ncbi:hypothetical protein [Methanobacterium sp.]|uniref:hypothetical protein n=1 Tax=Methanobacterium sp. TaxID=2164 RepID=UPI003C75A22A
MKICKYCGDPIKNPKHGNQRYHHEPHNGRDDSCVNLAHKDNVRDNVREHRKIYGRRNENIIGSRNANLGASALTNFDEEYAQVHKEKMRLVGS